MLPHYQTGNKDEHEGKDEDCVIENTLISSYDKEDQITAGFVSIWNILYEHIKAQECFADISLDSGEY